MNDVSKCKLYYFPKKNTQKKCKKVQEEMLITVILKI